MKQKDLTEFVKGVVCFPRDLISTNAYFFTNGKFGSPDGPSRNLKSKIAERGYATGFALTMAATIGGACYGLYEMSRNIPSG